MVSMTKRTYNLEIIFYYIGFVIIIAASLMLVPIIISIIFKEVQPLIDFIISISISIIIGLILMMIGNKAKKSNYNIQWKHGFIIASTSWIVLMFLCSLPYFLSGHCNSYLDACFDVMSGFTTTGLALTQDIDHLSNALNVWRHILTFIGGQGMVVLALSLLSRGVGGAYKMYVGEGKDIDLVPNIKNTARYIWKISMIYFVVGVTILWGIGILIGLKPVSAIIHAFCIFASSWSTGGFAPTTQNIMFYHSIWYEAITLVIFILGSFNFGLHYAIWQGKKREMLRNIEVQSFFVTASISCLLLIGWFSNQGIFTDYLAGFRRVIYNVLSAHTTTGFGTVYANQFALEWGGFGVTIMIIVMLIGGSACSTAGGIKGLRIGIMIKGLIMEVKKFLSSERNIKVFKFHHIKDKILDDQIIKTTAIILFCYLITFFVGVLMGTYYGYSLTNSAFEAASVTGNVGLSIGVTSSTMPTGLKIYYIIAMYLGRLEFLSVFALIGYAIGGVKSKCQNILKR